MARLLVVDDLADNRAILVALLRHQGHAIEEARDGEEALEAARRVRPDLIITDVHMPRMDGYELVRQLRLHPETANVAVMFYTAHYAAQEARDLALAGGVADVLTKPVEPDDVLRRVAAVLSRPDPVRDPAVPSATFDRQHLRLMTDKLSAQARDLRTANARLKALVNVGLELASERDTDRLLSTVCAAARELFGATYVTLGLVDRHTGVVTRSVTGGTDDVPWAPAGEPPPGVIGTALTERRAWRGRNPGGAPAAFGLPAAHPPVHALLVAPLVSPAHVYGWLCLVGNDGHAFDADDEQLLKALCGQVGRIYENGYFFSIAQARAQALEQEVIEREHAVAAVREAEARTQFALASAQVGIWDMDYANGVLKWSPIIEGHHGLAPGTFDGRFASFIDCIHPDDRDAVLTLIDRATRSGDDFQLRYRVIWPDGSVHSLTGAGRAQLDDAGAPRRAVGISLDVSEQRSLEQQYQQAQKMEAIGRLAGGIAHDFNNLLTAILGYCELLQLDVSDNDPRRADILEIQKAGIRASSLTRQLLAFSRKEIISPTMLDLNAVALDIRKMLERLIGEDVAVVMRLHADATPVCADRGQIEQVILNLAVNARDAMPRGGVLTIETANVSLDEHYANAHFSVSPGLYACLMVSDTGTGMPPAVLQRLFEPFFTTKAPGKGTGLGLATIHGIVTRYGGSVHVYSEVGRGTTFKVYLPQAGDGAVAETAETRSGPITGSQTVLLVEDSDSLRALTSRLLARLGYTVLQAATADDAVAAFERHGAIDVILTDVVMPGRSGPELARELTDRQPSIKVLYMSGYTEETIVHHGVLDAGIAFINKPFSTETLGRKLRDVLSQDPA